MVTGQLFVAIVLSVSLKQLWNLFNVMQVLAYSREFTQWPAMVQEVIKYIIEALYLKEVNNSIMSYGQSQFEIAKGSTKDEFLLKQGIEDSSLMKSLGVFAVSIALILCILLVYLLIKKCGTCCRNMFGKLRVIIGKKIFYSGPLRYVIVGYIKLFNQFLTLLLFGFTTN